MVFIEYNAKIDNTTGNDFGTRDGQYTMIQPQELDDKKRKEYQIQSIILSPEIPNIFSYGNFDNTKVKISNDGGTTWSTVLIPNGIYTINMIQDSITDAILQAGWIVDNLHIPIVIDYNPATRLVYIQLDSSQLSVGTQIAVDFGASEIYKMFGLLNPLTSIFIVDGTFSAPKPPLIDTQGTFVNVSCNLINGARYINGVYSNVIAKVPLVASSSQIEIVFPSATTGSINTPFITANIPNIISSFNVKFETPEGKPVVWLYGNAIVQFIVQDKN